MGMRGPLAVDKERTWDRDNSTCSTEEKTKLDEERWRIYFYKKSRLENVYLILIYIFFILCPTGSERLSLKNQFLFCICLYICKTAENWCNFCIIHTP